MTEEFVSRSFSKEDWLSLKHACQAVISQYQSIKNLSFVEKNATQLTIVLANTSIEKKVPLKLIVQAIKKMLKDPPSKEPTVNDILQRVQQRSRKVIARNPEESCAGCDDTGLISGCIDRKNGGSFAFRCNLCETGQSLSKQIPIWNDDYLDVFDLRLHRSPKKIPSFEGQNG